MKIMKKEKKIKVTPTQEQLNKMVGDYIKESSKHLFKVKTANYYEPKEKKDEYPDTYYKVIPVRDEEYCIVVTFDSNGVNTRLISTTSRTKNELGMTKDAMFPKYKKHKSVKQNKEVRTKFEEIQKYINSPISEAEGAPLPGRSEIELEIKRILKYEN
jgi:hypothetical protein